MDSSAYSPMDESSEIYSLYSHPAMTRTNTAEYSENLQTPANDIERRVSIKPSVSGPRTMHRRGEGDTARIASGFPDTMHFQAPSRSLAMVLETQEIEHDSYFSLPPAFPPLGSDTSALRRRRSTKELIHQFESLDLYQTSAVVSRTSTSRGAKRSRELSPPRVEKMEKKRSPLRQSLKNFLSVFSKRGKASSKDNVDISTGSPRVVLFPHSESKSPSEDPFLDRRPATQSQKDGDSGSAICRSPRSEDVV